MICVFHNPQRNLIYYLLRIIMKYHGVGLVAVNLSKEKKI